MPKIDFGAFALVPVPLLGGSTAGELIPELVRHAQQPLIELKVAAVPWAERHELCEERLGYRNGYRPRRLTTHVGDIDLQVTKLCSGSILPSILETRRRLDQSLYAVFMAAYVAGVSTRKADILFSALGSQSGISESQARLIFSEVVWQAQASSVPIPAWCCLKPATALWCSTILLTVPLRDFEE